MFHVSEDTLNGVGIHFTVFFNNYLPVVSDIFISSIERISLLILIAFTHSSHILQS